MSSDPIAVSVSRHFSASQERVFDAWLDADSTKHWLFATDTGENVHAEIDARVGGNFLITDRREGAEVEHRGVWLAIDRPRQLEFTYVAGDPTGESSRVIVHVVATESGCELTLTHVMSPQWADFREHSAQAWAKMLAGLARDIEEPPATA